MRRWGLESWFLLAAIVCAVACHGEPRRSDASKRTARPETPIPQSKTQLVTVVSHDWSDFRATLRRYERAPGERWRRVGEPVDVVLGRHGYGWGRGLHGSAAPGGRPGPVKYEGDGRSPAGVFEIGDVYGYGLARTDISLPYVQASPELRCVDDPQSAHYNRIVSTSNTEVDWRSAEHMRRDDELYVLAIVVEHNTKAPKAARGSCIFIHLWEGPDKGMSGCTAISMEALEALATWLEPSAAVLVALPLSEYELLKRPWELPLAANPEIRQSR